MPEAKLTPEEQRNVMANYLIIRKHWPQEKATNHCASLSDDRVYKFYKALIALGEVKQPD